MDDNQNKTQVLDTTAQVDETIVEETESLAEPEIQADPESEQTEQEESVENAEPEPTEDKNSEPEVVVEDSAEESQVPEEVQTKSSTTREAAIGNVPDELSAQGKWYVVHTYAGHENKVLATLKQRVESEHLENKIFDILVPTQDKIEIKSGKKAQVKEKIFPGYILVKMILDDNSWLAVRTTPGVTSFVGIGNKPTPISEKEVASIVKFMTQGAPATFKDVFLPNDTVKIVDGPFSEFIGKVDSVDKERGKVRVLVSIFGRETPVELDFLQVQKL